MPNPPKKSNKGEFLKYADMGFRMMAVIVVGVLLGIWLDRRFPQIRPYGTASLSIVSVFASLYLALRGVYKK